jgi:hypothetical protein
MTKDETPMFTLTIGDLRKMLGEFDDSTPLMVGVETLGDLSTFPLNVLGQVQQEAVTDGKVIEVTSIVLAYTDQEDKAIKRSVQ